jgi:hypothetical protein
MIPQWVSNFDTTTKFAVNANEGFGEILESRSILWQNKDFFSDGESPASPISKIKMRFSPLAIQLGRRSWLKSQTCRQFGFGNVPVAGHAGNSSAQGP